MVSGQHVYDPDHGRAGEAGPAAQAAARHSNGSSGPGLSGGADVGSTDRLHFDGSEYSRGAARISDNLSAGNRRALALPDPTAAGSAGAVSQAGGQHQPRPTVS